MPWSRPRFIFVAAKSIIEEGKSGKLFCKSLTILMSTLADTSFTKPTKIDSIPLMLTLDVVKKQIENLFIYLPYR